jgi:excisionase family DNA binding protein
MEHDKFVTPKEACKIAHVQLGTLRTWEDSGKIRTYRTAGGHRRYHRDDLTQTSDSEESKESTKKGFCYARVSTRGQKEDLERQVTILGEEYESYELVQDIGSGLNYKRKGFKYILDQAIRGNIKELVVTHKDRLCRFGFDMLEGIIRDYSHGKIVVLNNKETSPEQELSDDIISIITVFSGRLYGLRSHTNRKRIQERKEERQKMSGNEYENDKVQTSSDEC